MGFALGLGTVNKTREEEEEVVDVSQKLLPLTGELEGRFVFEDAGGETQEAGQAIILNCPILLVQDLTAGRERARVNVYIKTVLEKVKDATINIFSINNQKKMQNSLQHPLNLIYSVCNNQTS